MQQLSKTVLASIATFKRKCLRQADATRWSGAQSFSPEWTERAKLIAALIPKSSKVIEFGAGLRRFEEHLDTSCTYVPSDLVSRGPDTFVLNLEDRPLPDLRGYEFDVAVFAGVLEYISDVPTVIAWIGAHVQTCIASYECATWTNGLQKFRKRFQRAAHGWANTYSEAEFLEIFAKAGFRCVRKAIWHASDGDEPIFMFEKPSAGAAS